METEYNIRHAREILEPCALDGYLLFDERGVWPALERDLLMQAETEGLRWRPTRELQRPPGAPEVNDTPMLPNPFNARELAAFMLAGVGALVADFYGDWSDGPSQQSLNRIDPDSNARLAVIEAFTAYRLAIEKVGKWDADALARRDATHKAYWKSSNDKALLKAFDDSQAEWDAAYKRWLTAMVRELLKPAGGADAAPNRPAPKQSTYGWVETAKKMAIEIIERDRKRDLFPSQMNIADEIAKKFREAEIYGDAGTPLTGAYIKRHALPGISSARHRSLSTPSKRGK